MKYRMTTTPVEPGAPQEHFEASVSLKERIGLAIYVSKKLDSEEVNIPKELFTMNACHLPSFVKNVLSDKLSRYLAMEKCKEVYLQKYPGHYFDWE
jgi:hypothetical protein